MEHLLRKKLCYSYVFNKALFKISYVIILTQKTEEYPGKSYTNHSTLTKVVPSSDIFSNVKCDVNIRGYKCQNVGNKNSRQNRRQAGFTSRVYKKGLQEGFNKKGLREGFDTTSTSSKLIIKAQIC